VQSYEKTGGMQNKLVSFSAADDVNYLILRKIYKHIPARAMIWYIQQISTPFECADTV
jgi:hypothetical protein